MTDEFHVIGTMLVNRKRETTDEDETIKNASTETLKEAKHHLDSISAQIAEEVENRNQEK